MGHGQRVDVEHFLYEDSYGAWLNRLGGQEDDMGHDQRVDVESFSYEKLRLLRHDKRKAWHDYN